MRQKIDISTSTFIRLILVLLGLWFLYYIRDVLVLLFIVLIIVASLAPSVDIWAKKITRPGAVISIFALILLTIGLIFSLLVPPLVSQMQQFSHNLPAYAQDLSRYSRDTGTLSSITDYVSKNLSNLSNQLGNFSQVIFNQALGVINGIVAMFTVIVLSFYLLLEQDGLRKIVKGVVPESIHEAYLEILKKILGKLGNWLRGQLVLMLAVGLCVTIGLLIIGSPYALTLGLWAGLTEIIPFVGPWLGAIPGVAVGLAQSPIQGFLALVIYVLIQQLEANFLAPKIMSKAVGLNPVVVIIALLVGGKVYGIMGVLLAVPTAAILSVIVEDWSTIKEVSEDNNRK
jgi:predicted PurR-regulated permease PerM